MSATNDDENDRVFVTRVPSKLSFDFLKLESIDKFVLIPLGCAAMLTAMAFGSKFLGLVVFLVFMGGMIRSNFGRYIVLLVEAVLVDPWIRLVQHEVLWQAGRAKRVLLRRSPALNLHVTNIGGWLGVVHIPGTNMDAIIVEGSGSDISTQGIRQMHGRNLQIAEATKKVASQNGFRIGTSFLHRKRPPDPYAEMAMYGSICRPEVFRNIDDIEEGEDATANKRTPVENQAILLQQMIGAACQGDGDVTQASVWTIEREPALVRAAKGKKSDKLRPDRLTALQVARTARDNLDDAGVTDTTIMDYPDTELHLRKGWDVYDLYEYFAGLAISTEELSIDPDADAPDSKPSEEFEDDELNDEFAQILSAEIEPHWPGKQIKRGRNYCQLDGTYHSVLLITGQPEEVIANSYFLLHSISVPYLSVATIGDAFKITKEAGFLKRFIPIAEEVINQGGYRLDPTQEGMLEEKKKREREIHGSRMSLAYNILVDVAASSLDELEDRVQETERQLRLRGFEPQRITGRIRQIPAMLSATTGIPMPL